MKVYRTSPMAYTGVMFVHAARTAEQKETRDRSAAQGTARFHRDKKLGRKLDELLGAADADVDDGEGS